jgi:hypothetical protein
MRLELKRKDVKLASVQKAGRAASQKATAATAAGGNKAGQGVSVQDVNNAINTTVKAVDAVQTVGSLFGF